MLKRRQAIQHMATGLVTLFSLPAWSMGWNKSNLGKISHLSLAEVDTLTAITDTILPSTTTPGAKELGVAALIEKIVQDCQDTPAQNAFSMGLVITDAVSLGEFGKSFKELNGTDRLTILKKMSTSEYPDQKNFFNTIKRMTIDGYMRSEYVMTNITKFEMAPNRYYGCVPV